jgi:hypothetical protein
MGYGPIILPGGTDVGYLWWQIWTTVVCTIAGFFGIAWAVPMG